MATRIARRDRMNTCRRVLFAINIRQFISLVTGIAIAFAASACAPPVAIRTTALMPAKFDEAAKLKEVAVLPFDGRGGQDFAAEIEGLLAGVNVHDKQYFTLVDRTKISKALSELQLAQSGLVNSETAVKVGKMVGAKGLYTGAITTANSNDSYYNETRSRCASMVTKYNKKGQAFEVCERWESYNISCTKRSASFVFTPKLIEVETGRIVYASTATGKAEASACADSQTPLPSHSELLQRAKQSAKAMFRKDIAPHFEMFEIKLIDSTEGISSKEAERKFEQGIDFAKNNRLDRACELWGEARTFSPNSLSIVYSLGICAEVTGNLEQALDLYTKADRLLSSPNDEVSSALHRVKLKIEKQHKLKKQM